MQIVNERPLMRLHGTEDDGAPGRWAFPWSEGSIITDEPNVAETAWILWELTGEQAELRFEDSRQRRAACLYWAWEEKNPASLALKTPCWLWYDPPAWEPPDNSEPLGWPWRRYSR